MGTYEVCLNGHHQPDSYHCLAPEFRRAFCNVCGAAITQKCPNCSSDIKSDFHDEGVLRFLHETPVPKYCWKCGKPFPWADKLQSASDGVTQLDPLIAVERICQRFPLIVRQLRVRRENRPTIDVEDEYDVQDLLLSLLFLFFDDIRPEECTPSYAGKSTRMDFLLKDESVVIEVKMTRKGLGAKEVGEQLIVDIAHYKEYPNCNALVCLVYDPDNRINNPRGLEKDLSKKSDRLDVRVLIVPKGH